ncbi:MAG: extracellular solute-binding protein [Candidatus Woesebacteria bacterium]|nr:extracellular solute-binding protein [Candidatus Woesebacteria bacterium]
MQENQTPQIQVPQTTIKPKKKFSKKIIFIVIGILLALIAVFFAVKFLISGKSSILSSNEVIWWGMWEDEISVSTLISEYQAKNPKVKIKYVRQSKEDYRERLTNALAKGTGPDIFRFHNSWVPMFKSELDKMPATVYSAAEFSQIFYPVATSDLTVGPSIVGIPLEYDGLSLYINEEIFTESGKNPPTTWNELRQLAREFTIKDQNGTITQAGVALGRTENVDHWPEILALMMLQNGADLARPTGKLAEDALQFFTTFSLFDGVWDATLPSSTVSFAAGKSAMYFGPSWRAFEIRLQNPNLKFRTVPVPQLPKTSANEADVSYGSYWVEGVWARSKKKDVAWDFLKFISSKESLEKFYNQASKTRLFGEPYPRTDMESLLVDHPIIGSTVMQGRFAQTWFLQSNTWDGPTGINTQINKYFKDAVNAVNTGMEPEKALETVSSGVIQVLSQYGIKIQ